jgi:hypothetical protein
MCPSVNPRAIPIIEGLRKNLDDHAARCGDRILAIALSPEDYADLQLAELWGIPVLSWEEVPRRRHRLLCEADGVLVRNVETFEELAEMWEYDLQPPSHPLPA